MVYRVIADSEVDEESPITESLMTALRDNLEAVLVADDTAPALPAIGTGDAYSSATIVGDVIYENTLNRPIFVSVNASIRTIGIPRSIQLLVSQDNATFLPVAIFSVNDVGGGEDITITGNLSAIVGPGEFYQLSGIFIYNVIRSAYVRGT